jgi:trigger factor
LERVKIKKDEPFSFTATVEIKPPIELRDYRPPNPISLKPDKRTLTDEQVAQALDALREQQAQLHPAPSDAVLADGDYAVLDIEGFVDLAPLEGATKTGHLHKVGSKTPVLGIEVDEQLVGKKEGSMVEVTQPYPASHPDPRIAGKSVVFRVRVASIKRKQLAPLDDEFAKDCGPYGSLQELKDKLRTEMEHGLKRDIEEGYKDQVVKRLIETHHFELPEALVDREVTGMIRQRLDTRRRQRGGGDAAELAGRPEEIKRLREELLPEAQRRVKIGLILEAVAEKERLTVEDDDIQGEYARLAAALKVNPEDIRRMVEAGGENAQEDMRARLLAEKALDFVYRHAVIQG